MRSVLMKVCSAVLFTVCILSVGIWIRSYMVTDDLDWRSQRYGIECLSSTGRFLVIPYRVLQHNSHSFTGYRHDEMWQTRISWESVAPGDHLFFGCFAAGSTNTGVLAGYGVVLPYWVLVGASGLEPAFNAKKWLRNRRLAQRKRHNLCSRCGYDLRGSTSIRCPECGAACKAADPAGVSPAPGD